MRILHRMGTSTAASSELHHPYDVNLVRFVSYPDLTLLLAQLCARNGALSQCEDPCYCPIIVFADYRTHVSMQVHHFGP